jgi:hypothetical protein
MHHHTYDASSCDVIGLGVGGACACARHRELLQAAQEAGIEVKVEAGLAVEGGGGGDGVGGGTTVAVTWRYDVGGQEERCCLGY